MFVFAAATGVTARTRASSGTTAKKTFPNAPPIRVSTERRAWRGSASTAAGVGPVSKASTPSLHQSQEGLPGRSSSRLFSAGYRGDHCEVDVDECEQNPCENGGRCYQRSDILLYGTLPQLSNSSFSYDAAAGFICSCLPGFTGRRIKPGLSRLCEGWKEDSDEELLSQETTAPSMWTSAPPFLVNMEEAARMASTPISACVRMDSQVGQPFLCLKSNCPFIKQTKTCPPPFLRGPPCFL